MLDKTRIVGMACGDRRFFRKNAVICRDADRKINPLLPLLGLLLIFAISIPIARAAPFAVSENVNNTLDFFPNRPGDPFIFAGNTEPRGVLIVDVGENTAFGRFTCQGFGCRDDFEAFRLMVPDGIRITRTEFTSFAFDGTADQLLVFDHEPGLTIDRSPLPTPPPFIPEPCVGSTEARGACIINMFDSSQNDTCFAAGGCVGNNLGVNNLPVVSQLELGPGLYEAMPINHLRQTGSIWRVNFVAEAIPNATSDADAMELSAFAINVDGTTTTSSEEPPANIDVSGFDTDRGLGTVEVTVSGQGSHTVTGYFDHGIGISALDEFGETGGSAATAAQSWQIGDPAVLLGNVLNGQLDNLNNAPSGLEQDTAMATGLTFNLAADETATVSFFLHVDNTAPGFFLRQGEPDDSDHVFAWASVAVRNSNPPPDPLAAPPFSVAENVNNSLDFFPNDPGQPFIGAGLPNEPGVLTVGLGVNTAFGRFTCQGFGCRDDFESFRLKVPQGIEIILTEFWSFHFNGTSDQLLIFPNENDVEDVIVSRSPLPTAPPFITEPCDGGTPARGVCIISMFDGIANDTCDAPGGCVSNNIGANNNPNVSQLVLAPGTYEVMPLNHLRITSSIWKVAFTAGIQTITADDDGDGIFNPSDNCPVPNPLQTDTDSDGMGDACDIDDDNDGVEDASDPEPLNPLVSGDVCSDPSVSEEGHTDLDSDGIRDECDDDLDGDDVSNDDDNCPLAANPLQIDFDTDGLGDACDEDLDGDGVVNEDDNCPLEANPSQIDSDGDGIGDACDVEIRGDLDGDGDVDRADIAIMLAARNQLVDPGDPRDLDQDGIVTVLDARTIVGLCTRARCAVD